MIMCSRPIQSQKCAMAALVLVASGARLIQKSRLPMAASAYSSMATTIA
jgi:hypothetical protein